MEFNEFQEAAMSTAVYPHRHHEIGLMYAGLGIAGEAGEVADEIKKMWRNEGHLTAGRRVKIMDEIGDVLWYAAACSDEIGATLEEVAAGVIAKLRNRKETNSLKEHE